MRTIGALEVLAAFGMVLLFASRFATLLTQVPRIGATNLAAAGSIVHLHWHEALRQPSSRRCWPR